MQKNTWLTDYLWLALSISGIFFILLGCRALSVPDEARYTEIPREMLALHDFITPHLDGIKYFEKPPLLYWIQAGVMHFFGMSEWALRLPTALMGMLGCLVTYSAGRFLFDRRTGIYAAFILATSPLYFAMAHSITLDMTVSLWITLTLMCFIIAVNLPNASSARRYVSWLMYAAAALAVLTKGLIGILLPGFVMFTWLLIFNRWRDVRDLYVCSGLIIFLAIAVPWHVLVQMKNPEFLHFYFLDQQFLRYLTKAQDRYKPVWFFVPILIGGFFPWIVFLGKGCFKNVWSQRDQYQNEIFFLLWAIEIFAFFSFSDSKLIPYIVPVFPPLALLVGKVLNEPLSSRRRPGSKLLKNTLDPGLRRDDSGTPLAFNFLRFLLLFLGVAAFIASFFLHKYSFSAQNYIRYLAAIWFIMGAGLFYFREKNAFIFLVILQTFWLWGLVAAAAAFDMRPIKSLALIIKAQAKPDDIIASYGLYYQDLPVYTQRQVLIINWKNELTFGYNHQSSAKNWMMDQEQFWPLWKGQKRIFAVMDESDYVKWSQQYPMIVLAKHANDFLVTNQA